MYCPRIVFQLGTLQFKYNTRRLVGVHSGYMVLVSGPQNGQWQCEDVACWQTVCYADCLGDEYKYSIIAG